MHSNIDEVDALLLNEVEFLARHYIQDVPTLLLEDDLVALVHDLLDTDYGALAL